MKNDGFNLIELLIAMGIMAVILSLTFPAFRAVLEGSKLEASSEESYIDKVSSVELIRLDLVHTGFGISLDETNKPIAWNSATPALTLLSTLNNTNEDTIGWMMFDCSGAGSALNASETIDSRQDTSNNNIVLLNSDKKLENQDSSLTTADPLNLSVATDSCPDEGVYTGFPVETGVINGCADQTCNQVIYQMGGTPLTSCATGTQSLLRKVGGGAGDPILNCVADFEVRFDLDTNGDGNIDSAQTQVLPANSDEILEQVKNINLYILMQIGKKDTDLNSSPNLTTNGVTLSLAGVTDSNQYRWKIQRVNGKLMSW